MHSTAYSSDGIIYKWLVLTCEKLGSMKHYIGKGQLVCGNVSPPFFLFISYSWRL